LRTTPDAVDFLKLTFGSKYKILPITLCDHEEVIHLDAVFNIIDRGIAVAYKECLINVPREIFDYSIIGITKEEKDHGGCNFLNIDSKIKVFRDDVKELTVRIGMKGYKTEICSWGEIKKTGTTGPRCSILPLARSL